MLRTTETDYNLLEAEFYTKPFKFSYSSLNKLTTAPVNFYKEYVLKEREDDFKKYLLEGILIHFLVLENENFDEKFLVMPDSLPSPTSITIADAVFKVYKEDNDPDKELMDYPNEILEGLKEIDKHQSLKDTKDGTGDSKRLAKIIEPKTEDYFEFLKKQEGRTIIDSAILDKCTRRADIVKANPDMRELLGLDIISDGKTFGVYNELMLDVEKKDDVPFGYKGIVDNIVVNVKEKLIMINDFKTTSKSLTEFTDSVEYWNYWLQAAMYEKLVRNFFKDVLTSNWKIEFRFVVFDRFDQLYAFPVSRDTMQKWKSRLEDVEKEALYHYNSKDFTLPYKYALGEVEL